MARKLGRWVRSARPDTHRPGPPCGMRAPPVSGGRWEAHRVPPPGSPGSIHMQSPPGVIFSFSIPYSSGISRRLSVQAESSDLRSCYTPGRARATADPQRDAHGLMTQPCCSTLSFPHSPLKRHNHSGTMVCNSGRYSLGTTAWAGSQIPLKRCAMGLPTPAAGHTPSTVGIRPNDTRSRVTFAK